MNCHKARFEMRFAHHNENKSYFTVVNFITAIILKNLHVFSIILSSVVRVEPKDIFFYPVGTM